MIENGIDRLSIIKPPFTKDHIESINKNMLQLANNRDKLRKDWFNILSTISKYSKVTEEVRIDKNYPPRNFIFIDKIADY